MGFDMTAAATSSTHQLSFGVNVNSQQSHEMDSNNDDDDIIEVTSLSSGEDSEVEEVVIDDDEEEDEDSDSSSSSGGSGSGRSTSSGVSEADKSDTTSVVGIPLGEEHTSDTGLGDDDDEEDEWDVVNLSDEDSLDEEKVMRERDPKKKMICMKCPSTRKGLFRDKRKYFFHIKRHKVQGMFNCPTCRRPFVKISYCISHEIRVHELKYEFDDGKDPVITFAKEYVEKKRKNHAEVEVIDLDEDEDKREEKKEDEYEFETDCEDSKFYEDRVICSNSLMRYQGPNVDHWIQSYEIQIYNGGKNYMHNNSIVKFALQKHKNNAAYSKDIFRLGQFSWSKEKAPPILQKLQTQIEEEERERMLASTENSADRKSIKRKVVWLDVGSTSSEDDSKSEDGRSRKQKKKKRRLEKEEKENRGERKLPEPKKTGKIKAPKRRTGGWGGSKPKVLPAIITRVCMKCSYIWKTEDDLRIHRDAMHPNIPIIDLMAVTDLSKQEQEKVRPPPPLARKNTRELTTTTGDGVNNLLSDDIFVAVIKKANKKKKKTDKEMLPRPRNPVLSLFTSHPEKTFTEKEKFLHSLGLVHNLRVQLKEKTPVSELNLKECSITCKRLTPEEIMLHTNPALFNIKHFLLG